MAIKVWQLPNLDGWEARVLLWCPKCLSETSAHRDDYFTADPSADLLCSNPKCTNQPLEIVEKVTELVPAVGHLRRQLDPTESDYWQIAPEPAEARDR